MILLAEGQECAAVPIFVHAHFLCHAADCARKESALHCTHPSACDWSLVSAPVSSHESYQRCRVACISRGGRQAAAGTKRGCEREWAAPDFARLPICTSRLRCPSLCECRKAIRDLGTPASAELADKPQLALHQAVRESGLLMHCKGVFIANSTGNASQDAVRRLVVDLFQVSNA